MLKDAGLNSDPAHEGLRNNKDWWNELRDRIEIARALDPQKFFKLLWETTPASEAPAGEAPAGEAPAGEAPDTEAPDNGASDNGPATAPNQEQPGRPKRQKKKHDTIQPRNGK